MVQEYRNFTTPSGADGPKTGPKVQKEGKKPTLGVFRPNTDCDYGGCRRALIELIIFTINGK